MQNQTIQFLIRPILIDTVGVLFIGAGLWQKFGNGAEVLPNFLSQPYMAEGLIGIGFALVIIAAQELISALKQRNKQR